MPTSEIVKTTLLLALTPLLANMGIVLPWILTGWEALEFWVFLAFVVSVPCVLVGFCCLFGCALEVGRRGWKTLIALAALLVSNMLVWIVVFHLAMSRFLDSLGPY